jgi:putative cardiolipin synthase
VLAALDAHPRIELRLYNPFPQRMSRTLGYLGDFRRLNRRMHNKSFTVDNQASVVGGRNIANEYVGAAGAIGFADLDVLLIGPVVQQVSAQFDRYWNSASAYPAAGIIGPAPHDGRGLVWIDRDAAGQERQHRVDPQTDWTQRLTVGFLAGLPIDWLL